MTYHLMELMAQKGGGVFNLALSGGGTAQKMYSLWAKEYRNELNLERLRFYWVDERCVPPSDPESNYGHAQGLLFTPLHVPETHIFRIKGENPPEEETVRYSQIVRQNLSEISGGLPVFDCIILGVGDDLHTASIFPDTPELISDPGLYAVSRHPMTGQQRVTMTGPVILAGAPLLVPVVGEGKESVIRILEEKNKPTRFFSALHVLMNASHATVYVGK